MLKIVIALVFIYYLVFSYRAWIIVNKSSALDKKQKLINSILVWLIPFFWFFLINDLISDNDESMTKEKREKLNKKTGGFRESGTGITGP